jgi:hypothetical protein
MHFKYISIYRTKLEECLEEITRFSMFKLSKFAMFVFDVSASFNSFMLFKIFR